MCVCVQFGSLQAINDAMFEKGRVDIYSLYSCAVFSSSFNLVRLLQRGQDSAERLIMKAKNITASWQSGYREDMVVQ